MKNTLFAPQAKASTGLSVATLAPMVDIFTILVIAVLKASSPQPPLVLPEANMELPLSSMDNAWTANLIVDIGKDGVYVDGQRVTSREYWEKSTEVIITEVYTNLQQRGKKYVQIRAEASIPWSLLSKVIQTAEFAGYDKVELVVLSNSSL